MDVSRSHDRIEEKIPGWPELAPATTSAERVRIVAMAVSSVWWGAKDDMVVEGNSECLT